MSMPVRWSRAGVVLLLMAALLWATTVAYADEDKRVAVVIRFDDGSVLTEVVEAPTDATAADVLDAATVDATIAETDFGPALCAIAEEGCPVDDCFCDPDHFWSFWLVNEAGDGWESAPVGVGGHIPDDADVIGFAWTGFDEEYNPLVEPPFHRFADLAEAPVPTDLEEAPAPTLPPAVQDLISQFCGSASLFLGGVVLGVVALKRRNKTVYCRPGVGLNCGLPLA